MDGSHQYKSGSAGIGVICRQDSGTVVGGCAGQISSSSAFISEAVAFRKAMDLVKNFQSGKVCD